MKALVLETNNGMATLLREDGIVVTAERSCQVGESVELDAKIISLPVKKRRWPQVAVAAALAFTLLTGSYTYTTALACSYVSVDVEDASVELAVNRLGQVIEVKPLNENSQDLAKSLSTELHHKPVGEAVDQVVTRLKDEGYVRQEAEPIVVGVTAQNEQQTAQLSQTLERSVSVPAVVQTVEVSPEQRQEAKKQELSAGRYAMEQGGKLAAAVPGSKTAAPTAAPVITFPAQESVESALEQPQESEAPKEESSSQIPQLQINQGGVPVIAEDPEDEESGASETEQEGDPSTAPEQPDAGEQLPSAPQQPAPAEPRGDQPGADEHPGEGSEPGELPGNQARTYGSPSEEGSQPMEETESAPEDGAAIDPELP